MRLGVRIIGQSEAQGALPQLYAATRPTCGGEYYGPNGFVENRGYPKRVDVELSVERLRDRGAAVELSEDLTGVGYDALRGRDDWRRRGWGGRRFRGAKPSRRSLLRGPNSLTGAAIFASSGNFADLIPAVRPRSAS